MLRPSNLKYTQIVKSPIPIWFVEGTSRPSDSDAPVDEVYSMLVKEEHDFPEYRGVKIERLQQILLTGVDVEPTDAALFASDIDKAWEYPSMSQPRVVYALRKSQMKRSWTMLTPGATEEQIAETRREYPHQHENSEFLRFSRIAEQDRNLSYENAYGYWVPGNAKDALVAIFLFGYTADDFEQAMQTVQDALKLLTADTE